MAGGETGSSLGGGGRAMERSGSGTGDGGVDRTPGLPSHEDLCLQVRLFRKHSDQALAQVAPRCRVGL